MKNKVFAVIRTLIFILVTAFILSGIYRILKWKDTNGDYLSTTEQLYNTDRNLMDAVVIGSSHVYCGVNPAYIWENYGISLFDLSTSGQDKVSSVALLRELLKTQNPKVVIVDAFGLSFDYSTVEGNVYRNLLSMKWSPNTVKQALDYMSEEDAKAYLPVSTLELIARWPVIHSRYKELTRNDFIEYVPNLYTRGEGMSYYTSEFNWWSNPGDVTEASVLSERNKEWIDDFISLSEKYGFELIFMVVPYNLTEDGQKDINAARDYCNEKGVEFWDYNLFRKEIGLDTHTDFHDDFHLNAYGAEKFSKMFAEDLLEQVSLEDHRGDEKYSAWDMDVILDDHVRINYFLNQQIDLLEAARLVRETTGYTCVIGLDGNVTEAVRDFYRNEFEELGIAYEEMADGGRWLYRGGESKLVSRNDVTAEPYISELNDVDSIKIQYAGFLKPENIIIGGKPYEHPYYYVTIVVYDDFLKEVVFTGTY